MVLCKYCSIAKLLLISNLTSLKLPTCVKTVADTYIAPGIISVYYPPVHESAVYEHVEQIVGVLTESSKWTLEIISGAAQPIPSLFQKNNPRHRAVIIFYGQENS